MQHDKIAFEMALAATFSAHSTQLPKNIRSNELCPCNSGRKFKHCCLGRQRGLDVKPHVRDPAKLPKPRGLASNKVLVDDVQLDDTAVKFVSTEAPGEKNATAIAMLNAGISRRIVWAYLETGIYMTEANRSVHSERDVVAWENAVAAFDASSLEEQQILIAPAVL